MNFAISELCALAARAAPLHERWQNSFVGEAIDCAAVEVRLQRWRQALTVEGNSELLIRRLSLDGVDVNTCSSLLGSVRLANEQSLPGWAERLNIMLRRCHIPPENAEAVTQPLFDADNPLPFQDLWPPFVECATEDLRGRAGATVDNLSETSLRGFQKQLLGTLSRLATLPLALEFRFLMASHDPLAILPQPNVDLPAPSRDLYRRFIADLLDGGLLRFFQEYAVLARLVSLAAEHWAEFVAEFCRRLEEDRPALAAQFHSGHDLGSVVAVKVGLSDPHHCGRSVVILTFSSGPKIVYKPKDLGIDQAYLDLIEWLNRRSGALPLCTPKVLNCSTHGWAEFVEHLHCRDCGEAERYYERIGMLLALTYVLGGTDFHVENVIASGEHPMLVDLESMLQPLPRSFDSRQAFSADRRAAEIIHASVLRTGLLPSWRNLNPGRSFDASGIGAEGPQDTGYQHLTWVDINTNRMRLVHSTSHSEPERNLPILKGEVVSARNHLKELTSGFATVYRLLLARRDELLAAGGVIDRFRGLKLRMVLRATRVYGMVSQRLLHPEFLRDGADRSIELDRMAWPFLAVPPPTEARAVWGIYRAELEAIERSDIPFFSVLSDAETLLADGQVAATKFIAQTGLDLARSCIRGLSDDDLLAQSNFICASLYVRFSLQTAQEFQPLAADLTAPPLTNAELIATAVAIAEQIRNSAIRGRDGGTTWLSLSFDVTTEKMTLLPMTDELYDGRIGVAFFLAALEHITGGAGFRDFALSALMPLRQTLQQPLSPVAGWSTLGAATGLGSQLYGLVRIAEWLADGELLDLAAQIAAWFVPQRIARDEALDVIGGAAGGILSLLAWSAARNNRDALKMAVMCGEHLLEKRIQTETGYQAWRIPWAPRPLTGFAHGAAGIAYALLRLAQATGDGRFWEAAQEGVAYETAVYSDETRNWPDFREATDHNDKAFGVAWCRGATGIGLARLGGLPALDTPSIRQDILNALETTLAASTYDFDHLCCGNMGRGDFLIEASRRLTRPDLLDKARQRASPILRRAARNGDYRLLAQVPGVITSSSLFQGLAGIGYSLLRLAEPERLPCLLLWE